MSGLSRKLLTGVAVAAGLTFSAAQSEAAVIPIELVLAIDASGSISNSDYDLQVDAYANVLSSALIPTDGTIAIGVIQFGADVETVFDLQVISSALDKAALLAAINGMDRTGVNTGATAIGDAVNTAQGMLAALAFADDNQVVDVSTDGQNNSGADPATAVAGANGDDTRVNCLGVGPGADCSFINSPANLGLGAFSVLAPDFDAFETALEQKIRQETGQVPEPATLFIVGLGLAGLGLARRRRS